MPRFALVLSILLTPLASLFAQDQPARIATPTTLKDPQAVAVAQRALATMGGPDLMEFRDVTATGTTTLRGDTGLVSYPIVLSGSGKKSIWSSIQKPNRTDTYFSDGTTACFNGTRATGVGEDSWDRFARRIDFVPALSVLREYADSNVQLSYVGANSVGGKIADVIAIGVQVPDVPSGFDLPHATQRLFFVDQSSGLLLKMQYSPPGAESSSGPKVEVYFSNYQNVSGFSVPFTQSTYIDGKLGIELALQSVTFNSGIPGGDSAITCEAANAQ